MARKLWRQLWHIQQNLNYHVIESEAQMDRPIDEQAATVQNVASRELYVNDITTLRSDACGEVMA